MNREGCAVMAFSALCVACALLFLLAGCASTQAPDMHSCPPLKAYSTLEQNVLAGELAGEDGQETQAQIEDYMALRQACRTSP